MDTSVRLCASHPWTWPSIDAVIRNHQLEIFFTALS